MKYRGLFTVVVLMLYFTFLAIWASINNVLAGQMTPMQMLNSNELYVLSTRYSGVKDIVGWLVVLVLLAVWIKPFISFLKKTSEDYKNEHV